MRWSEFSAAGHGLTLHVRRVVDPPATPVLLLHGLGVGGSVFQAFARRLLPHLAAVAPDLRGHGESDAPSTGYAPRDYALDLVELIETELSPTVGVVGHSLGALVGLSLAELRPALVSWLVLLDPPLDPALRNPEIDRVFELRDAPEGELEAYLLERNPGGGRLLADQLAHLFRQAADAAFEAMLERPRLSVPKISKPTLIIQADPAHGGVLGDAAARAAADALGSARLIKITGATHAVHASRPAETASAILEFAGYSSSGASSR
jgi:pimeloyl-ACP methyl ester carboxylesterase